MKKEHLLLPLMAILVVGILSLSGCSRYMKTDQIKEDANKVVNDVKNWIDENNIPEKMNGVFDSASDLMDKGIDEAKRLSFDNSYEDGFEDGTSDRENGYPFDESILDEAEENPTVENIGFACGYYDGYDPKDEGRKDNPNPNRWFVDD